MNLNQIIQGDCKEVLKTLPDNCVDSIVTDPPYGIGFMGKEWDTFKPEVLNEGISKSSRKKSYLNPERSKYARKGGSPAWESARYNRSLEGNINYQNWYTEIMRECLRVLKPGGHILSCCGTRTYYRMAVGVEDAGFEIRDMVAWLYGSGFPKNLDISKAIDKQAGMERKITTEKISPDGLPASKRLSKGRSKEEWDYGTFENDLVKTAFNTEPSTPEAKQWDGWGTALKPAMELWVLGRKPLGEKTVAENVLKHGTGGINIDGSRVDTKAESFNDNRATKNNDVYGKFNPADYDGAKGRWPANLIHDGLSQDWAKFFYSAKASVEDRDQGLEERTPERIDDGSVRANLKTGSASVGTSAPRKNIHPTVKPTDLMRYLVKLITPPGGIVLDPFMGSGSTGKAAVLEGFNFIGIEREAEYIAIAEARIKAVQKQQVLNF